MSDVYLSLGSNLGNRLKNLKAGTMKIPDLGKIKKISSVYQTGSWGFEGDDFFNIALCLDTHLKIEILMKKILDIECQVGRKREETVKKYESRILDIDIIFFNDEIVKTKEITIPHPRVQDRNFVLIPMIEIKKKFKHPIFLKTLEEIALENRDLTKIERTEFSLF